ncbi:MAG: hypothetical protein A2045_11920 [Rhodocyclales bacterium GWA2_65_20]|nr:MAG: hypothetical protein A2045_11920 [Rhodocyclales bacterium GWA2_65_20]
MSQCDALVVETTGSQVWVEVPGRVSACGNCKTPDLCQGGLPGLSAAPRRYLLDNPIGARVGDRVSLTVADGTLWRASVASYVLPVLLAIGGAAIGQSVAGDAWALVGSLIGIGAGLALLRRGELRARRNTSLSLLQVQINQARLKDQS